MSDNLRTRIAAAISGVDDWRGVTDPTILADAVIRELGLEREFSIGDDDGGRVLWLADEKPATPRDGEVVEWRWISRWARDE